MSELAIDLIISGLLMLTTTWCILVYLRLHRLKLDREDLTACITALDQALTRAEDALSAIRDATVMADSQLARRSEVGVPQQRPPKAQASELMRGAKEVHPAAASWRAELSLGKGSAHRTPYQPAMAKLRAEEARPLMSVGIDRTVTEDPPRPADPGLLQRLSSLR